MAIVWTTSAGSLGTIEERVAYTKTLTATGATSFSVLAGSLPSGLYVTSNGVLKGTPSEVTQNTQSKFVIRATDGTDSVDRTFELTVQGPDAPTFTTPSGTLLNLTDGEYIDTTIVATDSDDDIIKYYQAGGELPPGVLFNQKTGRIYGVVTPQQDLSDTRVTGWDMNPFDQNATQWDDIYRSKSVSRYYRFKVRVTDGSTEAERQFDIYVATADEYRADTDRTTADGKFSPNSSITVTADSSSNRTPVFTTPSGNIGVFTHENYHIAKIEVIDPDSDLLQQNVNTITYSLVSGSLPPGMNLDSTNGEIFGTIKTQINDETTYTFTVKITRTTVGSLNVSAQREFNITIRNDRASQISWTTPAELSI
jgi:hypothetical protein